MGIGNVKKYGKNIERMRNSFEYNEGVRRAWTPIWVRNAHRNYHVIEQRFAVANRDMAVIRGDGNARGPALVLGSGPSLEDVKPHLKDWKGAIWCSTSHLPLFAYLGIEPTYVMLIDADPSMCFLVTDYAKDFKKTIFITHPQVPRELIEAWPEDRMYFFRMLDPSDHFSNDYLGLAYGWMNERTNWAIQSTILNGGNIINSIIPLASAFGYSPLFLCGYDLGYPDNLRRCSDVRRKPDGEWEIIPAPPLTEQRWVEAVRCETNNGVPADELCIFYKTSTIIMLGMSNPPVLSCSRGIVSEIPYVNPREVIEKQGVGFEHLLVNSVAQYKMAQEYLEKRGFLILKTDYWVSVSNLTSERRWLKRMMMMLKYRWYKNKPWKWMGGAGYVPYSIKRAQRAKKREDKKNVQR